MTEGAEGGELRPNPANLLDPPLYASRIVGTFSGNVDGSQDLYAVSVNENHDETDDDRGLDVDALVVLIEQAVQLLQQAPHDEVAVDEHRSSASEQHVQKHRHRGEVATVFHRHINTTYRHVYMQMS